MRPGKGGQAGGRAHVWISGARATQPRKPSTMEGIPASTSMIGLRISRCQGGGNFAQVNGRCQSQAARQSPPRPPSPAASPPTGASCHTCSSMGYQRRPQQLAQGNTAQKVGSALAQQKEENERHDHHRRNPGQANKRSMISSDQFRLAADVSCAGCSCQVTGARHKWT
jgi:hypothetical protein